MVAKNLQNTLHLSNLKIVAKLVGYPVKACSFGLCKHTKLSVDSSIYCWFNIDICLSGGSGCKNNEVSNKELKFGQQKPTIMLQILILVQVA